MIWFTGKLKNTMLKQGLFLVFLIGLVNGLTYSIDTENEPTSVVSEYFLSVALDITNMTTINLAHPHLTKLVKHLSPMHFRIGGTQADIALFEDDTKASQRPPALGNGDPVLQGSYWLKLFEFSKNANVRLLFDLNSLLRKDDGSWNSENAEEMIKFSQDNGVELDWELGNEPDLYTYIYNKYVEANQLGNDYEKLRTILNTYELYKSSYLVGPSMFDVGSSEDTQTYLKNFQSVASSSVHAVTWHHYYFGAEDATEDIFLNPATFNYLEQRTKVVTDIVGTANKVWLGETSSANHGGALNMSDRFLASFLWLDKLGLGAKLGLDVIVRQTIWGYNYPLLDVDYNPNPDWWLSILYKRLVGTKVISTTNDGEDTRSVRLYAQCAKQNSLWDDSAVVVFGLNIANSTESFSLAGLEADNLVYVYELTAESSLYSKSVRLNGDILSLTEDLELPEIEPKIIDSSDTYTMPAYSLAFWVFSNTNVKACQ